MKYFIFMLFVITYSHAVLFSANNFLKFDKYINGNVKVRTEIIYFDTYHSQFRQSDFPIKNVIIFNKDKIRIEEISYKNDDVLYFKKKYVYNDKKNIKLIKKYVDNELSEKIKFLYDKHNNCIETSTYNNKNELIFKVTGIFFCRSMIKQTFFDIENNFKQYQKYRYDSKGNVFFLKRYVSNDPMVEIEYRYYDGRNNLIKQSSYKKKLEFDGYEKWTYNNDNKIELHKKIDSNYVVTTFEHYVYVINNDLVMEKKIIDNSNLISEKYIYDYDKMNNPILEKSYKYNKSGKLNLICHKEYKYEYFN